MCLLMDEVDVGEEAEMRRTRQLSVVSFQLSLSRCTIRSGLGVSQPSDRQ